MKMICVDNKSGGDYLTIGKVYDVGIINNYHFISSKDWCWCINDRGEESCYRHRQFMSIKECRREKIKRIKRLVYEEG